MIYSKSLDNVPPSQNPPGGLSPSQVPQFITIGFDDNSQSGINEEPESQGISWVINFLKELKNPSQTTPNPKTYDGAPCRVSFYMTTTYMDDYYGGENPANVRNRLNVAYLDGHEIGNHTHTHNISWQTSPPNAATWRAEIDRCNNWLTKPLAPDTMPLWKQAESDDFGPAVEQEHIYGFRTPFLAYGGDLFPVLKEKGLIYDCTIEEGAHASHNGTNFRWPYTLDNGSPGHTESWLGNPNNPNHFTIKPTPGLWELPNHVIMIPPDNQCGQYGVDHSIKNVIIQNIDWFDANSNKFTCFDYNIWAQAKLNKAETLALLKYALDLRLQGNRAPFMIGAHSDYFHKGKDTDCPSITLKDRQEVFEEFIAYALTKDVVRIVPAIKIIEWCRNPVALGQTGTISHNRHSLKKTAIGVIKNIIQFHFSQVPEGTAVPVRLFNLKGAMIAEKNIAIDNNKKAEWNTGVIAGGLYVLQIHGKEIINHPVTLFK
jgi:prepilin-type processing-associated H-X9-DG protein